MVVKRFDPAIGLFWFQLEQLEASLHAHPVIEICWAQTGTFCLSTDGSTHQDCTFAVLPANTPHSISSSAGNFEIMMVENREPFLETLLNEVGLPNLSTPLALEHFDKGKVLLDKVYEGINQSKSFRFPEARISTCLSYLNSEEADYFSMVEALKDLVHLSESRLTHLFKQHLGVSLKSYLVWSRLKRTIHLSLVKEQGLLASALEAGFYDQAHFGRAFKKSMGISPAKIYNSVIVQASEENGVEF